MIFYINKNKSIRLVKFNKKHISKNYLQWLNSKEVKNNRNRFSKHTYPTAIKYFNKNKKSNTLFVAIEIFHRNRYVHIGNTILIVDAHNKRGHLSILIGENSMKNKGIGYIVWKKMIELAFKKFNCRLVVAGTMKSNKAMFKIFKKCKMKTLSMPNYFFQDRKKDDLIIAYKFK
ncbi:MAG: hypothetical protein CL712_00135 [Chloroflexi bacterium]|nr:hypothetical protein [Chloroflexota bacterium]|tara:strand:- start:338 stop:859 length:522 start_codon:yes stop_codon:yes gene_type:complete